MSERTYKQAFVMSAVICLVLVAALAYVMWGRRYLSPANDNSSPVMAKGPDVSEQASTRPPPRLPLLLVRLCRWFHCNCLRNACRPSE